MSLVSEFTGHRSTSSKKTALSKFKTLTASLRPQQSFGLLILTPTLMKGLEPVTKSVGNFSEFQVTAG